MQLTPLHYAQKTDTAGVVGTHYGSHNYVTDCGRFMVNRQRHGAEWYISVSRTHTQWMDWGLWLSLSALMSVTFKTRRAALEALTEALSFDELYDADDPTTFLFSHFPEHTA